VAKKAGKGLKAQREKL